jgi:hypothetical protein
VLIPCGEIDTVFQGETVQEVTDKQILYLTGYGNSFLTDTERIGQRRQCLVEIVLDGCRGKDVP